MLFRSAKTFHCNFSKYVNGVRLNYAVAALENTMDSITNICLDCVKVKYEEFLGLLTGDIGEETEKKLLELGMLE